MLLLLLACTSPNDAAAQLTLDGTAVDFELDVVQQGARENFRLSDHEGDIILLDMSAFW